MTSAISFGARTATAQCIHPFLSLQLDPDGTVSLLTLQCLWLLHRILVPLTRAFLEADSLTRAFLEDDKEFACDA